MLSRIYTADVPLEHVVIIDFVLDAITSFDRIWSYSSKNVPGKFYGKYLTSHFRT